MTQTTKTITNIKVSPEEMKTYKEEQLNAAIQKAAAQVQEAAAVLLQWAADAKATSEWTFMSNKDVYYIPEIVGVMPNLRNFAATFQKCSDGVFVPPSAEQMKFSDFSGDFPTQREAAQCFLERNRYFRKSGDGYIYVRNEPHDGATCKIKNNFCCFNVYRNGTTEKYGDGSSSDYGWNIPIHRFHGNNSSPVSFSQTLFYWLQYDLRPEAFKANTAQMIAYNLLRKRREYLVVEGDGISLDAAKTREAIKAGTELSWMPKEAAGILSATTLVGSDELVQSFKNMLLHCDEQAVALDPYDEKILTDPNRGHWDIWEPQEETEENALLVDIGEGVTARNPAVDVSEGIVAIDFGTKSTVVVYETDNLQVMPLQVGSGSYGKGLQEKDYENPTVLQFIDLEAFLADYAAKEGRPATSWDDLTVSHNAFQNLKDASSDKHGTFFEDLKQWCGTEGKRLKLQDAQGKVWELPPFMELKDGDVDPLEIYAYYLGRYINHMLRGKIFLHYIMSFPVTYEHRIREHMGTSIRKGLRKSLPAALLADEEAMKKFCVREVASEPAAYAITALQEYGFAPEGDEEVYYAVFDFGGGTTDFDFGMFKESADDRYDYVLTHFGENGDRTLGGENLLRLLAFEVFRANVDYLLRPDGENGAAASGTHIPFAPVPDAPPLVGYENLLKDSGEAQQNIRNLMEKLRPVWQEPESEEAKQLIASGQIQITLYRANGEKKTDAILKLATDRAKVDLEEILRDRIELGIRRFFTALAEAFDKSAGTDNRIAALSDVKEISVFLAGNSSRSPLVEELFREYTESDDDEEESEESPLPEKEPPEAAEEEADEGRSARSILKFGDEQPMPKFEIYPPLGTKQADELREADGVEDTRDPMMRPTGKTGVAYGLLQCRAGGNIKVETITPDGERVPFQYYIGRHKKGKFKLIIDRNAKLKTWYKFIDAGDDFDILYTERPEAATGNAPMTIAKHKHVSLAQKDKSAFVYVRPVESKAIEYTIAHDENELATGGDKKSDPVRIELG